MRSLLERRAPWLLLAILAAAAALRFWGIDFGLPYDGITYNSLTIEEIQEVHRAMKLGAGEYSWMFGKGGLYLLLFIEYGFYYGISWLFGWVSNTREFAQHVLQDRTTLYLIGRVTVALMGVATCFVVYQIAKRLYDQRVALGAALIGATAYYHAAFSAVINVDIGMTLALWTSVLVYLEYEKTAKPRFLLGAGALGAVSIAFKLPGAVILPLLWIALATTPRNRGAPRQTIRECATLFVSLLVTLTVIAPEWVRSIGDIVRYNFSALIQSASAAVPDGDDLDSDIEAITILHSGGWQLRYLEHLVKDYNVVLTASAAIALVIGMLRRNRWDLIIGGFVVVFVGVMSLSDRTQAERYLLPIMPALWILGSRGAMAIGRRHWSLTAAALGLIVAVPSFGLVRQDIEKMQLDTRVHAKLWIEANVPSGAKILMDGMRYRLSQAPPLNPDPATVARSVKRASKEGEDLGRGVSKLALSVYKEALGRVQGPTYELISTDHGLEVETVQYYVDNCFNYIVTSSLISERFAPGGRAREDYPDSANFYDSLSTDPRVRLVHEELPIRWKKSGPTIRIYKLATECGTG